MHASPHYYPQSYSLIILPTEFFEFPHQKQKPLRTAEVTEVRPYPPVSYIPLSLLMLQKCSHFRWLKVYKRYWLKLHIIFKHRSVAMSSRELQDSEPSQVAGFILKTFQILKNDDEFNKIIYWAPSGVEFVIKDVLKFQQVVLPRFFRHNKINSFIRQLNMYGFHKSRADHSKSVFSHPAFIRGRDDLLITIKRKIKDKTNPETHIEETPLKKDSDADNVATAVKENPATEQNISSVRNVSFPELPHHFSFNMMGTKQQLKSIINLNVSLNRLPHSNMAEVSYEEESDKEDCVSIEHQMEGSRVIEMTEPAREVRFISPSCFFDSMK